MNIIDLLKKSKNKLEIFSDSNLFNKYNLTIEEFLNIISTFLSDEEKLNLFNYSHIKSIDISIQKKILNLITNNTVIIQLLSDQNLVDLFYPYEIVAFINKLNDSDKINMLYNKFILTNLEDSALFFIISTLSLQNQINIFLDSNFINNILKINSYYILTFIENLLDENIQLKLITLYELEPYNTIEIIENFSTENKIKSLYEIKTIPIYGIIEIIQTFNNQTLINFFNTHQHFLESKKIEPYQITYNLDSKVQKYLVNNIDSLNLGLNKKLEILASLPNNVKKEINSTNLSKEYQKALLVKSEEYSPYIKLDLNSDLSIYQGLDNLINIMSDEYSDDERNKFLKLLEFCPNLKILNTVEEFGKISPLICNSTVNEYILGEKWISNLINSINPSLSPIQKIALIDHAIGKKISYTPDFDTETFNNNDCRALWKIITSGYGVCNGIAKLEYYILNRIGIKSHIINSDNHTFLKLINIELPASNGNTIKGNTILDPTWNLSSYKYNAKPNNFCISYTDARDNDIDINGNDSECHKNDKELIDANLSLDDENLRNIFKSIGLTKENGNFPVKDLIDESNALHITYQENGKEDIVHQLALIPKYCPEFAKCQFSTLSTLDEIIFDYEYSDFSNYFASRVYNKKDPDKKVVIYIFIDSEKFGQIFFVPSKDGLQFTELTYEEFIETYECYESDLKKDNRYKTLENSNY